MRAGLRSQELCDLKISDVRCGTDRNCIHVRCGKGGKSRVVAVDTILNEALSHFMDQPFMENRTYLFETRTGQRLHTSSLRRLLSRVGSELGLPGRLHPHGLRATMATDLVAEGVPLDSVSAQLGHAHVSTTDIYVKRVGHIHLEHIGARA